MCDKFSEKEFFCNHYYYFLIILCYKYLTLPKIRRTIISLSEKVEKSALTDLLDDWTIEADSIQQ